MKKIYQVGIISAIFVLSGVMALNMYSSTSFPGFHSDAPCNFCHNDPVYAREVTGEISVDPTDAAMWDDNQQWSLNEVPMVNTNNRSEFEFFAMQWLTNSTHVAFRARIPDDTMNSNDKFAIIWNIDVSNFTVGEFLTHYAEEGTSGSMSFSNGHADMWFWKASTIGANSSGATMDYYIDTSHYMADSTTNGMTYTYYGGMGGFGNPSGWILTFVRELTTGDANDVQFETGSVIQYALAHWNDGSYVNHMSSFDKSLVVGDQIYGAGDTVTAVSTVVQTETETKSVNVTQTLKQTETETVTGEPSGTTSSFTLLTLVAGLAIAIPLMSYLKKRK
jgi:hypothetical protein